jgi:hypothetical protein
MNKGDVLRCRNLLLAKRQELSTGKDLVGVIPTAGELRGDRVDMAASETDAAMPSQSPGFSTAGWAEPCSSGLRMTG